MKKVLLLVCFSCIFCSTFSQSTFDKSLNEVSSDIAEKLSQKNKKKIVVLYVTDINKVQTIAGKYIADEISYNIVNNSGNFQVFNRNNLPEIIEAKKMISEGYIDAIKAKELGKVLAVEGIIIGNYTVFSNTLKLSLQTLDVNNGLVIAASRADLPLNNDAKILLGIYVETNSNNSTQQGFNGRPLNSNESYNSSESINAKCKEKNTGDYCFSSKSTKTIFTVSLYYKEGSNDNRTITIQPGQTQCIYDFPAGSHNYLVTYKAQVPIMPFPPGGPTTEQDVTYLQGQINIEQCKSKTFVIKIK